MSNYSLFLHPQISKVTFISPEIFGSRASFMTYEDNCVQKGKNVTKMDTIKVRFDLSFIPSELTQCQILSFYCIHRYLK